MSDPEGVGGAAEVKLRGELDATVTEHGDMHEATAVALNNFAQFLQDEGRLSEAEPLMRRALAAEERVFGPSDPHTALTLNNLAMLLKATGELEDAERMMDEKIEELKQEAKLSRELVQLEKYMDERKKKRDQRDDDDDAGGPPARGSRGADISQNEMF